MTKDEYKSRKVFDLIDEKFNAINQRLDEINQKIDNHIEASAEEYCQSESTNEASDTSSNAVEWLKRAQRILDIIVEDLDIAKIHSVMESLNWKWYSADNKVPTEDQIRNSVRNMAIDTFKDLYNEDFDSDYRREFNSESGGIRVEVWEDNSYSESESDLGCRISFVLTESSYND